MTKKCLYEGCNKQPVYNNPTESTGIYCSEHKKETMINVVSKRCIEEGCNKQPSNDWESCATLIECILEIWVETKVLFGFLHYFLHRS